MPVARGFVADVVYSETLTRKGALNNPYQRWAANVQAANVQSATGAYERSITR